MAGSLEASRSLTHVSNESVWAKSETLRHFLLRETKTREMVGYDFARLASWDMKTDPTPPAPVEEQC